MAEQNKKMTTETLQGLINARAEKRLTKDLQALHDYVNSNKFFNRPANEDDDEAIKLTFSFKTDKEPVSATDTFDRLMNMSWGVLKEELYRKFLPDYIKEETHAFLKKVDELRVDVDQLFNQKADRYED